MTRAKEKVFENQFIGMARHLDQENAASDFGQSLPGSSCRLAMPRPGETGASTSF
jgi:hypothetical protein